MKSGEHHLSLGRPCIAINFFPQLKGPERLLSFSSTHNKDQAALTPNFKIKN